MASRSTRSSKSLTMKINPNIKTVLPCDIKAKINSGSKTQKLTHPREEELLKCQQCSYTIRDQWRLKRHQRTHSDIKQFSCELCSKQYRSSASCLRHHRIVHEQRPLSKSFKCSYCDYACAIRAVVTQHERTHTGEKPLTCFLCNKTFAWGFVLENHIRTHTGEKPFKCSVCKREFATEKALYLHKVTHEDAMPFRCKHCEKGFKRKLGLTQHERSHGVGEQIKCDTCARTFNRNGSLLDHIRSMHSDARPFSCSICSANFKTKSNLRWHQKIHLKQSKML